MPNYREIMDTQVKARDGFQILWVRDDSMTRTRYSLMGAIPITLTKQEKSDPAKRRSRAGELHVTPEGNIKLGDALAWEIPIELHQKLVYEMKKESRDRLQESGEGGGDAAPYLAAPPIFKMRVGDQIPNDAAPKDFGKPETKE